MTPTGDAASLADLVAAADYEAIAKAAAAERRVLSRLQPLTYHPDDLTGWRAAWAMGVAAARVADAHGEFVRNVLRRLMWSLTDESAGGIGWRSTQAMGCIVAARPDAFPDIRPCGRFLRRTGGARPVARHPLGHCPHGRV